MSIYERYYGAEAASAPPEGLGDMFTPEWTREAMAEITDKAKGHLTKVRTSMMRSLL